LTNRSDYINLPAQGQAADAARSKDLAETLSREDGGEAREVGMYQRILLAYDGSVEGRGALREGALLARRCEAQVFLLSVVPMTPGLRMAEGAYCGAVAQHEDSLRDVLEAGAERLRALGFSPVTRLAVGEPAQVIAAFAAEVRADLVVVGHRRQGAFERWWSGAKGGYLVDHISCSLLIVRAGIGDKAFDQALRGADLREAADA
jgi:nucleotide-binding universal stress UspA family protein